MTQWGMNGAFMALGQVACVAYITWQMSDFPVLTHHITYDPRIAYF